MLSVQSADNVKLLRSKGWTKSITKEYTIQSRVKYKPTLTQIPKPILEDSRYSEFKPMASLCPKVGKNLLSSLLAKVLKVRPRIHLSSLDQFSHRNSISSKNQNSRWCIKARAFFVKDRAYKKFRDVISCPSGPRPRKGNSGTQSEMASSATSEGGRRTMAQVTSTISQYWYWQSIRTWHRTKGQSQQLLSLIQNKMELNQMQISTQAIELQQQMIHLNSDPGSCIVHKWWRWQKRLEIIQTRSRNCRI